MGLNSQDRLGRLVKGAATSIYRISIVKRTIEDGLAFLQAYGRGDPDDAQNQELLQEADLDHVQHFGFKSSPPQDTEAVVAEVDGGECTVGERDSLEDLDTFGESEEIPALVTGDTSIYAQDGAYIMIKNGSSLTIRGISDDVYILAKSGDQVRLGKWHTPEDLAVYRDIAYAHTTESGASKVAVGQNLDNYMTNVDTDLAAIKADLAGLRTNINCLYNNAADIATVSGSGPVSAVCTGPHVLTLGPVTSALAADSDHSYVSSGSTNAEVEP